MIEEKALYIDDFLEKKYPGSKCGLEWQESPFKLLVMAVLSAQSTDARVNIVAQTLFDIFPTPASIACSEPGELEKEIKSIGLYNSKAKNLRLACKRLVEVYNGNVPPTMEDLLSLAGVGRKVANLIRGDIFGLGGIVADTHCIRLTNRFGFVDSDNPLKVEKTMEKLIPAEKQSAFCHRLVLFGREVCRAQKPDCGSCGLNGVCEYYKQNNLNKIF